MKLLITGGSGFIGSYLINHLIRHGHHIISIGRSSGQLWAMEKQVDHLSADVTRPGEWQEALSDIDGIVNLAGATIFHVWTKKYKRQIYESRISTTRNLVSGLPDNKPMVLLSASAAGYYGDRKDDILSEEAGSGDDFLASVCIDWEREALSAQTKHVRAAVMRFGVVLGKNGGALRNMVSLFKKGLGGPLGNGRQWFPWIHIHDLVSAIVFALETDRIKGPVNFCAPEPIRNKDFARALGSALRRPSFMPAPAFMIRLIMGELGKSLLNSQRTVPTKLSHRGFTFQYPDAASALDDLI